MAAPATRLVPVRKAQPSLSDVHVNRPLGQISVAYMNDQEDFVADKVFPIIPVTQKSDSYYTYPKGAWFRPAGKKRAPSTESAGIGYDLSTASYDASVWAVHDDVDDQIAGNADSPIRVEQDAAELVTQSLLITREVEWATKYFTTSVWTTDRTGVAASPTGTQFLQFNDAASDPLGVIAQDVVRIKERTGRRPNTLVMGGRVWQYIKNHPDLVARVNGGQTSGPAMVLRSTLAALTEIPRIFVMEAVQNTAVEGAADVLSFIGDKAMLLVYSEPNPGLKKFSGGYTFAWTGYTGATELGTRISRIRADLIKSWRIEGEMAFDMKLVAADAGVFYTAAVA
jgi:hypothetical protein